MPTEPDAAEPSYAEAVAELEGILDELEAEHTDVDLLAARVRRASELISLCRERIERSRVEVEQIVATIDDADGGV